MSNSHGHDGESSSAPRYRGPQYSSAQLQHQHSLCGKRFRVTEKARPYYPDMVGRIGACDAAYDGGNRMHLTFPNENGGEFGLDLSARYLEVPDAAELRAEAARNRQRKENRMSEQADIQDTTNALTGPNAALLYRAGSFTYLAFSTTLAAPSECDACGKRTIHGFDAMFLGRLDCCLTTCLWSCSTACLRSNLLAKEVEG